MQKFMIVVAVLCIASYSNASIDLDQDNDGILDSYETIDLEPSSDNDLDGFNNLQEFRAGTNPLDANDFYDPKTTGWSAQKLFPDSADLTQRYEFGSNSAIGKGTVFLQAPYASLSGYFSSAVYEFIRTPEGWVQNDIIRKRVDGYADRDLGRGMVAVGDFLFLGHKRFIGGYAVTVYERGINGKWGERQVIYPPINDSRTNDGFGKLMASDGETLMVSLNVQVNLYKKTFENYLFFFKKIGGSFVLDGRIHEAGLNTSIYDSIDIDGDMALAGRRGEKVEVLKRIGGQWALVEELTPQESEDLTEFDFGASVSIDEKNILVGSSVGYSWELREAVNTGRVYTYSISKVGEIFEGPIIYGPEDILSTDVNDNHRFGRGVALRDGDAIVGNCSNAVNKAAVYRRSGEAWIESEELYRVSGCHVSSNTVSSSGVISRDHLLSPIQMDADEDGILDQTDNCPNTPNPDQSDRDGDEIGNACDTDADGDSVEDVSDNCPLISNPDQLDLDGDFIGDSCDDLIDNDVDGIANDVDNCPAVPNTDQADNDGDNQGDACDADDDNDGIKDTFDNCSLIANEYQDDNDNDHIGDVCDSDDDNDAIEDDLDNCPLNFNVGQDDNDGDGVGDDCDPDDDNDAVNDSVDNCPLSYNPSQFNTDGAGAGDACNDAFDVDDDDWENDYDNCPDIANRNQSDFDQDNIGDVCDRDIDGDAVVNPVDACELTPPGELVDTIGCTIEQLCPCDTPRQGAQPWKNHGQYISCMAKAVHSFSVDGVISTKRESDLVNVAAQGSCGY
jgi:hypothetical protein